MKISLENLLGKPVKFRRYKPTNKYAYVTKSGKNLYTEEYIDGEQWRYGAADKPPIIDESVLLFDSDAGNLLPFEVD